MNVHGNNGIINLTGMPGSRSNLIDCRNPAFFDNIENGILETVQILVSKGFLTYSSCQGHDDSNQNRCVSIAVEKNLVSWFIHLVEEFNKDRILDSQIFCVYHRMSNKCTLYRDMLIEPYIVDIVFGDYRDEKTRHKQEWFNSYIKNHQPDPRDDYHIMSAGQTPSSAVGVLFDIL